jgi:hypothetical protein
MVVWGSPTAHCQSVRVSAEPNIKNGRSGDIKDLLDCMLPWVQWQPQTWEVLH